MNAERFMELMNTLPDDMIVTAVHAEYRRRPKLMRFLPAIAACLVIGIFAAVYPKLRIQTPEITEPPESVAEIITTMTSVPELAEHSETQTATSPIQTSFASATVTVNTTASDAALTTVTETVAPTATNPAQTDAAVVTDPPKTDAPITQTAVAIETTALTEQHIETTDNSGISVIIEDPTIEIPLWKGMVEYPESVSKPHLYSRFSRGTGDMNAWMRTLYGIPQDYDLTQKHCLLVEIDTAYSNAVIIGCKPVPNGLTLIVAYLDDGKELNKTIHYAMQIPYNMTLEPDNCNADYLEMTNEELIQEMEKDKLRLKTENEQEGLQ